VSGMGNSNLIFNTSYQQNIQKGKRVFDYDFLMSLDEKYYPKYLSMAYFLRMQQKLNLFKPKFLSEKVQWLKLYDNSQIKTQLTDKILVRNWVKNKIGAEYLKEIFWIGKDFNLIPFNILPNSFVLKTNHGCKWQFIIKNKEEYLNNLQLQKITENAVNKWLHQSFFGLSDFETQYKLIEPQILIEKFLRDDNNITSHNFEIWCFNGIPMIFQEIIRRKDEREVSTYDENYNNLNLQFIKYDNLIKKNPNENLKKAVELSKILAKDFKFVRVDWMLYKEKLYFEEMTFTPNSGFFLFHDDQKHWNLDLGKMLKLKGA
jgi:hypothetical protein